MTYTLGLFDIPEELRQTIVDFLPQDERVRFRIINKQFKNLSDDDVYWRRLWNIHFPDYQTKYQTEENFYQLYSRVYPEYYKNLTNNERKLIHLIKSNHTNLSDNSYTNTEIINCLPYILDKAFKKLNQNTLNFLYSAVKKEAELQQIDLNHIIKPHGTILHWAILYRQPIDEITKLLSNGIDLSFRTNFGFETQAMSYLHYACNQGNNEAVDYFLTEKLFLVDDKIESESEHDGGFTPLHLATINNQFELAMLLLHKFNANPAETDFKSSTPFHIAAEAGFNNFLSLFLEVDKSLVNNNRSSDDEGPSSLTLAVGSGDLKSVQLLVEAGANLDYQCWAYGETALQVAIALEDADISEYLISKGADINLVDKVGDTALSLALEHFGEQHSIYQHINNLVSPSSTLNFR